MENNKKEVVLTRTFDAPRETVWKVWTDEKLAAQWWGGWGPDGVSNLVCKIDARPGGMIHIVVLAGEKLGPMKGSKWVTKGTFREVTPPERLVFTFDAYGDETAADPLVATVTSVMFEEQGDKTKVTVTVEAIKEAQAGALAGLEMGWTQQLERVEKFLG
jgi:uncharacterized protein YndB with AHSA1/START domain